MNVVTPLSMVAVPDGIDCYAEYLAAHGATSIPSFDDILGSFGSDSTALKSFGQPPVGEVEKSSEAVDSQLYDVDFSAGKCC